MNAQFMRLLTAKVTGTKLSRVEDEEPIDIDKKDAKPEEDDDIHTAAVQMATNAGRGPDHPDHESVVQKFKDNMTKKSEATKLRHEAEVDAGGSTPEVKVVPNAPVTDEPKESDDQDDDDQEDDNTAELEAEVRNEFEADPEFLVDNAPFFTACPLCGHVGIRWEFRLANKAGGASINCGSECIITYGLSVKGRGNGRARPQDSGR